ncbi:MAG: hypothetical protein IK096_03880, partial [Lachnospiraceae bacterium]|nr:hypothetical protein [Lachnospiraceae bacterium]
MPNNLNDNLHGDQIVPEDQRDSVGLADLFDRDGEFYTTDNRTEEERTADLEERERQMRGSMLVDGFFDDDEVRDRLEHLNKDVVPGMLKKDAPTRMMNDLRTYYLGKGECSYTTKEPVTDAEGNPAWDDNGERRMQEVVHTVPVTSLAQAFDLNNLPYEARKQIVNAYLTDLENHPFGPAVDDETAAASARYYASIHKRAMERANSSPWPGINVNDPAAIKNFSAGNSTLATWAFYSQDFAQNTELFANSGPAYEKTKRNRVRQAYLDEFGGVEEYSKLLERQNLPQGLHTLARIASTPGIFSLKHRALAKYYLDIYNTQMNTVTDLGPEAYREGLGLEAITNASFFADVSRVFPEEGAPTDAQLTDYLDGKIDAPFSDEYIEVVEELASTHQEENSRRNDSAHRQTVGAEIDYAIIYNLSYVPMPHETRDAQGRPVRESVPLPDVYALTKEQQVETDRTFDRTLGQLTGNGRTGMQAYYCMMKGERTLGRFRIDGMPAMDYLAANGFPQIKADLTGRDAETAQKAALMAALADPARTVTFVPYVLNKEDEPVEAEPMRIDTPGNLILPSERESILVQCAWPDNESAKYYAAFVKHSMSMTGILAIDPDLDVAGIQTDERMKKAIEESKQDDAEAERDLIPQEIQSRFFYTLDDEGAELPHEDFTLMRNYLSTGKDAEHMFSTVRGTGTDGSLDGEGRKNLASVKSYMNVMRDKTNEIADSHEKRNPILAEYLRTYTDELRTEEVGAPWLDLMRSDTYSILRAQLGGIGAPNGIQRNADSPKFMDDLICACAGYPAGDPSFRLPQAVSCARRQTIMLSEHERSGCEGTQDVRQDRASRRMLLSEMDVLEKELRSINTLAEKSRIPGSPEADYCDMMRDSRTHRRYLDNPASDSSAYYPRGTKPAWLDMQGKRAMLANGWPLEDLNLLGHIYVRRQAIIDDIEARRDQEPEAQVRSWERSCKVLDQIITELEKTPIRNDEDRRRMLTYIDSYGDNFYTDDIAGSHPQLKDQLKKSIREAIAREPKPHEFLSEEELAEARAAYGRYQERKNGPDPDAPTVNGPRTDTEYAFLNTERIGALYTMRGRLAQDGRFSRDPVHAQTLAGVDAFLTHVDEFYANTGLLAPEREAERAQAFDRLVRESATLSTQIDRSITRLTDNG